MFPLPIFPGGGFDASIITVVFLGLLVMWGLTETLGFVFIGLVVPGYLASVIIIAPTTAVVVLFESVVTYLIVRTLSDGLPRLGTWSVFFGRDRFFAFVLVSLFVRLIGELWLWPELWSAWTTYSGYAPRLPGALTSVGLVLVPLGANMFWKVGISRGLWQLGVPTLIVYTITRWVLLPLTNLRFSEFQVHYEDVAIDIIASPKAYVVLIVAAALAARANIRFGWDFGGILIPALLAISWFDVAKGFVTIGEALVLAAVVAMLLRAGPVRRLNLEGPRRIVFVFATGFLLKYVLAWALHLAFPHLRVTDFFGFGYLLSSLLALRILHRKSVPMVLVPALSVSVVGFVAGGLIIGVFNFAAHEEARPARTGTVPTSSQSLQEYVLRRAVLARGTQTDAAPLRASELAEWEAIVAHLRALETAGSMPRPELVDRIEALGLVARVVREGDQAALVISEPIAVYPDTRGWGMVILRPGRTGPTLLLPDSGGAPFAVAAALDIARETDARAVLVGAVARTSGGRVLYPDHAASSPYHVVFRAFRATETVEIRSAAATKLWVGTELGARFPLGALTQLSADVVWEESPHWSYQREIAEAGFATLTLDRDTIIRTIGEGDAAQMPPQVPHPSLEDAFEPLLLGPGRVVARSLIELGPPPTLAEIAVARRAVLAPLVHLGRNPPPAWRQRDTLRGVRRIAHAVSLEVEQIELPRSCWWLVRENASPPRGWGFAAVRCDGGTPLVLLNPLPLRETSSWRFAARLAQHLDARGIGVGAISRGSDTAPLADPTTTPTLLGALQRSVVLDSLVPGGSPVWTVQVRGLGADRDLAEDALISLESPVPIDGLLPADVGALADSLEAAGIAVATDVGASDFASLRGHSDESIGYAREVTDGRFVHLWLSAPFRATLVPSPSVDTVARTAQLVGLDLVVADELAEQLRWQRKPALPPGWPTGARDELVTQAQNFARTSNPVVLRALAQQLQRATDLAPVVWAESGRVWLAVAAADGSYWAVRLQVATPSIHVVGTPGAEISERSLRLRRAATRAGTLP